MAAINPSHLFDQADRLIVAPAAGPPRQVDLRRAISNAYYGVFHYIVAAAADEFVGVTQRSTTRYALVYRSVDHRTLRDLCIDVRKQTLPAKYTRYAPVNGFGADVHAFSTATLELQEKRHSADYDPVIRLRLLDAQLSIATARSAIVKFEAASASRRKSFLTLLAFPPR